MMRWHYDTVEARLCRPDSLSLSLSLFVSLSLCVSDCHYYFFYFFYSFTIVLLKNHLTVPDRRLGATAAMMSCSTLLDESCICTFNCAVSSGVLYVL